MLLANAAQIREADRLQIQQHKFPGILLMEEAARKATQATLEAYPGKQSFLVLAGPGNNGGDGLAMARQLFLQKKEVRVLLSHDPSRYVGDALINYQILSELPVSQFVYEGKQSIKSAKEGLLEPLIIDALLGTGIENSLRGSIKDIIETVKQEEEQVIAIDLPSGLDASSGSLPNEPLQASHTFTFQLPKICNYVYPAASFCGKVHVLDIGLWPQVITRLDIQREILTDSFVSNHYKPREENTHKGTYGHVLVIGGSRKYAGAIAMTAYGALKAGAGLVTVVSPDSCRQICHQLAPEIMHISTSQKDFLHSKDLDLIEKALVGKDAIILGPGMGQENESHTMIEALIPKVGIPSVWDADALNLLAKDPANLSQLPEHSILSPHPGEMRRLIQPSTLFENYQVNTHRLEVAEQFVNQYPCTLVLKGAGTIISSSLGKSYVNTSGNPGMATAGSGDILSGILGTLLAQHYPADVAAALAVYLHGRAGDRAAKALGQAGMLATDIAKELVFVL